MSKTYNDPAKQLSREKFREFIKIHTKFKKPKDIKVVCFPGAEVEGEEALEVKEIYDPLGIPRANIIGLERGKEEAERLRRANLGIRVEQVNAHDYFLSTPEKFDIISLDYKGQQTITEVLTLSTIASRQLLREQGVLSTVYFGNRESKRMKYDLARRLLQAEWIKSFSRGEFDHLTPSEELRQQIGRIESLLAQNGEDLTSLREGITVETINTLTSGTLNYPVSRSLFSDHPRKSEVQQVVRSESMDREVKELLSQLTVGRDRSEDDYRRGLEQAFFITMESEVKRALMKVMTERRATALIGSLVFEAHKGYIPRDIERYSYTSNSGSNMLMDLFQFGRFPTNIPLLTRDVFKIGYEEGSLSTQLNHKRYHDKRLVKAIDDIADLYHRAVSICIPQRIKLTPDQRTIEEARRTERTRSPSDEEKLEIYSWLRDKSASDADICTAYNINSRQLAAYKAWNTMNERDNREEIVK
ncbi:MAG: hypothetical protein AABX35_04615 [Nanoarchaeota archaeon]